MTDAETWLHDNHDDMKRLRDHHDDALCGTLNGAGVRQLSACALPKRSGQFGRHVQHAQAGV